MVGYDVFLAFGAVPRAVDWSVDGLWDHITAEREDLIAEAKGRLDAAAKLISERIEPALHPYVCDEDIADVAVALALEELEDWHAAVEEALYRVEQEAGRRYDAALLHGVA